MAVKLRVGLIGQGGDWDGRYLPSLRLMQDRFEVRGVYHSVGALAEQAARQFDVARCDSFRSLIARDDIDAVLLLEADWYGTLPLRAACDFGKAVFCGSQIPLIPAQAAALKQRVDQAGIAFMGEFPRRYSPATLRLKELIATRLGPPKLLFCHRRLDSQPEVQGRGLSTQDRGPRELTELVDWCRYVVGRNASWVQAAAQGGPPSSHPRQYSVLTLGFPGNSEGDGPMTQTLAQISCGAYIPHWWHEAIHFRPPAALQVCCEQGLAFIDLPSSLVWFDQAGRHQESLESELPVGQQLLSQFHRTVFALLRKVTDLEDLYVALRTIELAEQAAVTGQRISLLASNSASEPQPTSRDAVA